MLWLLDYRPPNIYPHTHGDEEEELQNEEEKKEIKGKGNLGNARKKIFFTGGLPLVILVILLFLVHMTKIEKDSDYVCTY